jgi:hypothetical protein
MARYLIVTIAAAVILGDGFLSGWFGGRWQDNNAPAVAAEKIQLIPLTIHSRSGDWEGQSQSIDEAIVKRAEFAGYLARTYTRTTEKGPVTVNVLLACGRPGPLAVHTPEVCYGGAGFGLSGEPVHCSPEVLEKAPAADFWKATFVQRSAGDSRKLRVLWSWNKDGKWGAAANPRWTFAGAPVLYKLYVTQQFDPKDEASADAAVDFLRDFLPVFDKTVNPDR